MADNHNKTPFANSDHKFISDTASDLVQLIITVTITGIVSIIGIITNIINIIVFVKQGAYRENGSVNLLGLAVSDLCCMITMVYLSLTYSFAFMDIPNLPWRPFDLMFISASWPKMLFAQITRAVTAYVAFERCICVVFPFKVKSIFTPKRSIVVVTCIFLGFMASYSPAFIKQRLEFRRDPSTNITKLVLVFSSDWKNVVDIMWYINSIAFNIGSVAMVLICTLITVSRVKLSKAWRESMTTGTGTNTTIASKEKIETKTKQENKISKSKMQKEKKLIAMITSISLIFLICYIPDLTFLLMYTINPDIRSFGKYNNLALMMYALTFLMESINSSINIIIYYKMSSKYRQILRQWWRLDKDVG